MHITAAAAAAFFAGLAVAVPASPRAESYSWSVTGWEASYSATGGSKYAFDIAGPAAAAAGSDPARPAISAHCTGANTNGYATSWADCTHTGKFEGHLVSRLLPPAQQAGAQSVVQVEASIVYAALNGQPDTYYNLTGKSNTKYNGNAAALSFAIVPSFVQQN